MKRTTGASRRGVMASMAAAGLLTLTGAVMAQEVSLAKLPVLDRMRVGKPEISADPAGRTMTITQHGPVATIDWTRFDIAEGHQVTIVQPDSEAVIVNRVTGAGASRIDGALSANGKAFLINPDGITFGKTARVDVGGFVASTHRLSDEAMKDASTGFVLAGGDGRLVQQGAIVVTHGGILTLASSGAMEQSGKLSAPAGAIHLAAAEKVTLAETGKISGVDGGFRGLDHTGSTSAREGEVIFIAGRFAAPKAEHFVLAGVVDASGSGQVTLRSDGPFLDLRGQLHPGRRLLIDEGIAFIKKESSEAVLAVSQLERWLNGGVDVEFRRRRGEFLYIDDAISAESGAAGSLTMLGWTSVDGPVHLGAGDFRVEGDHLSAAAPIRTEGAITVKTSTASLGQVHAAKLSVVTPVIASFSAKGKVYDGTTAAEVDDMTHSGITLREGSNLRLVPSFAFDSAGAGERTVSASMALTGFNGDATTPINVVDGRRTTRIEPRPLEIQVDPVRKPFDGTLAAAVSIRPLDAVAGSDVGITYRSAEFHSSEPGERAVTVTGLALTGRDAGNYRLDRDQLATTGLIAAPPPGRTEAARRTEDASRAEDSGRTGDCG